MSPATLVLRSLTHYWRTNLAVVLGVATAVAVLAGALLVGDSVRGSLRDLLLAQLGATDRILISTGFFRDALADDIRSDPAFASSFATAAPLIVVQGQVAGQANGRRSSRVAIYGVDDRFWRFHGLEPPRLADDRTALLSDALATDVDAPAGTTILVRVERPTDIPLESLHGRKDDRGRTIRLTVGRVLGPKELGQFSLRPQQAAVRAVFVPLTRLQQDLDVNGRVNTLLISDTSRPGSVDPATILQQLVRRHATLEDEGLSVRTIASQHTLAIESAAGVLDDRRTEAVDRAAARSGFPTQGIFTYLANDMRSAAHPGREVPYSLVTATDLRSVTNQAVDAGSSPPPVVINDWTASNLGVTVGDPLTLEYYVWEDRGEIATRSADFRIAGIVPIQGAATDRDLAPVYPGITTADSLSDWDPPFPIDLRRVRRVDEDYWKRFRTTPKAFIPFEVGQRLWRSRYGDRTSMRIPQPPEVPVAGVRDRFAEAVGAELDPFASGFSVVDVRADGVAASRGATDFGEYFAYFSFFIVVSALLLAVLFFRLGIEQRARDIGLFRAVGYPPRLVRLLFAAEGMALSATGAGIGIVGAILYAAAMMAGLRRWWSGAVGTTALTLHITAISLAAGAVGVVAASMVCVWWSLRVLARASARSLASGATDAVPGTPVATARATRSLVAAGVLGTLGILLVGATMSGAIERTGAFFGAGTSFLAASLCALAFSLRRRPRVSLGGHGMGAVAKIGVRNVSERPGRAILATGVIASAVFILIAVSAFRRDEPRATDRHSGTGGYSLLAETLVPVVRDVNGREGREALGLTTDSGIEIEPLRLRPGDDASCLNLYEPRSPRILGVSERFIDQGRFAFQSTLAANDEERANPWRLLNRTFPAEGEHRTDVVPVAADANSMTYVLHKQLGDDIVIQRGSSEVRLRLVAALADSIFQSELLMSASNFRQLFPDEEGYRVLLVSTPEGHAGEIERAIEQGASDLGADAVSTTGRLAEFHRVENTYLSTFQTLGGLGLLVGTVGLAAIVLRNVLERRRELALLGAVGYRQNHIVAMVLAENALLVAWGLAIGTVSALIAIAPTLLERGGRWPLAGSAWLVVAVAATGIVSSVIAARAALGGRLLAALRTE